MADLAGWAEPERLERIMVPNWRNGTGIRN
jgi:hypothetical protein